MKLNSRKNPRGGKPFDKISRMEKKGDKRKGAVWRKDNIEKEKAGIKRILDELADPKNSRERLHLALKRIADLIENHSPTGQLRRFIYTMSVLSQHLRHGGLTPAQIRTLADLAGAILKSQGIEPGSSKLSYLYGDLHLILSQIYWKAGEQWAAAWEQHLANYLSAHTVSAQKGIQSLGVGIRLLRLGHATLAVSVLEEAERQGLSDPWIIRGRLELVKALRLCGELVRAKEISEYTLRAELRDEERTEFVWEGLCRDVQRTKDVEPIMVALLRGDVRGGSYVLEAYLWSRVCSSRNWLSRFPTIRKWAGKRGLDVKPSDLFYRCAKTFEMCYDYETPYNVRLERLGRILSETQYLISFDKEILVWAAASRWLSRGRFRQTTLLVYGEYRARSLRLSDGRNPDAFGLLQDLQSSLNRSSTAEVDEDGFERRSA